MVQISAAELTSLRKSVKKPKKRRLATLMAGSAKGLNFQLQKAH